MAGSRIGLGIAAFGLEFKSDFPGIISVLRGRYGKFRAPAGRGTKFSVSAFPGRQSPFRPAVREAGGRLELARGDFRAVLDLRSGEGELESAPREQTLDAFLRSLLSALLLRSGGLMLHSAGLVKNGKAYLFPGRSGAGKSTLSKLAAGAGVEVLSDEINLLRRENGRYYAYGSPFWGEMRADGRPGRWPLGGIFLLGKSRLNAVHPCGSGAAMAALLRCLLNFEKGQAVSGRVMANAAGLLGAVPAGRLEFSKRNADFLELI